MIAIIRIPSGSAFSGSIESSHEEKLLGMKFESLSGIVTAMATRSWPFRDQSKSSREEKLLGMKFESPSGIVTAMATRMIDIQNEGARMTRDAPKFRTARAVCSISCF
ncbi:hypothetical protein CEXT_256281 [Caerostris extrusa]|uniref:Uncharacterized protein n=1 Tax=Caerostris extrusa TaxID=172846 RepID=A0AAV4PA07_CAEEX|nr:hypothetical protein CEXT_256281 [Caerostris extrusa]